MQIELNEKHMNMIINAFWFFCDTELSLTNLEFLPSTIPCHHQHQKASFSYHKSQFNLLSAVHKYGRQLDRART
jgi:hypothetical protein